MCNESWTGGVGEAHPAGSQCRNINYMFVSKIKVLCADGYSGGGDTGSDPAGNNGGGTSGNPVDWGNPNGQNNGSGGSTSTPNSNGDSDSGSVITSPVNPHINNTNSGSTLPMQVANFQETINNNINIENSIPNINSKEKLQNFFNNLNTNGIDFQYSQQDPTQKTASAKFWLAGPFGGININLVQNISPSYNLESVNSNSFGFTLAFGWSQSSFDKSINGNVVTVNVAGVLHYNLFIDGVGTIFSENITFEIKINKTTGNIISAIKKL